MKAAQVRTLILKNPSLVDLQGALDILRSGKGLTALESGTVDYDPITDVPVVGNIPPRVLWDGTNYVLFFFVGSG